MISIADRVCTPDVNGSITFSTTAPYQNEKNKHLFLGFCKKLSQYHYVVKLLARNPIDGHKVLKECRE